MTAAEVDAKKKPPLGRAARASRAGLDTERRARLLADAGYNPLELAAEHVEFDLKTDSWAQLSLPTIAHRTRALHGRLQRPMDVGATLRDVFPFAHVLLTDCGRSAERIFYKAFPRKGVVLQNLLFPTNIYHQIDNGFEPVELPHPRAFELQSTEIYKSDLAPGELERRLAEHSASIALACLESSSNAAGGLPVSMQQLRQAKALLAPRSIPLLIDATRVVENARFLIEHEAEFSRRDMWSVVQEMLSHADVMIGSLTKDFCVSRGGILATNDAALFQRLQQAALDDGHVLDSIDARLVAASFGDVAQLEAHITSRMSAVRRIHSALQACAAPVATLAGGHCVLIDPKRLDEFRNLECPVASFTAWLYRDTGIRAGAHSAGMQRETPLNDLVRLAIPIGMKAAQIDCIVERLIALFERKTDVPELTRDPAGRVSFGDAHSRYVLRRRDGVAVKVPASTGTDVGGSSMSKTTPAPVAASAEPTANATSNAAAAPESVREPCRCNRASRRPLDIAVVGMAGRYPEARNVRELWNNLAQGKDSIVELPAERYTRRLRYGPATKYRGGFIADIDRFDPQFFNIAPKDAENTDPQLRLFLEVAWEVLEDAGYYPESLARSDGRRDVGVFVGAVWAMYQMLGVEEKHLGHARTPNSFLWGIANRVSYWMNLSGPSITLDTACSSSLTALYLACEAIAAGDCSSAIVGGVNLDLHQSKWDINSAGGALSKDGVCRSFGRGANGYVAGEGVGALYIKPLHRALEDRDHVYGVIKSVVVNHGGRTSGYMVPNPKAQTELIRSALERANVDPRSIGYVEAHGTGTELGDPLEVAGLRNAFEKDKVPKHSCAIGSVKTNIGHLEAAAGVVGVTKVLLQMQYRKLVPSLHSQVLNEFIDFDGTPFHVQQRLDDWHRKAVDGMEQPLRAGVSSFGAGGANAHVILEAYENSEASKDLPEPRGAAREWVFPLSARNEEQLREMASRLREFIANGHLQGIGSEVRRLQDVAHTLQVGRRAFDCRVAIVAGSEAELTARLADFIAGREDDGIVSGHVKNAEPVTRLLSRKERSELLDLLAKRRDPAAIARLWVNGVFPDWRTINDGTAGCRVPLPTYPFADKRYWVSEDLPAGAGSAQPVAAIHPLLDANESTFGQQLFTKRFHARDFFIYDHLVGEVPTLPGVAYLELARKAGEIATGRPVRKIRNVLWVKPIMVENGTAIDAVVELQPRGEVVHFEVFSTGANGEKLLHSQGSLVFASKQDASAQPQYLDIGAIRARCAKVLEGSDAYPLFKSVGLNLGPSFQVLREVYRNEQETLGMLELPEIRRADLGQLLLHPSLMDGALQAGVAAGLGARTGEMLVPFSIGEVEILQPLPSACFSYVTDAKEGAKEGSRVSKRNVLIVDAQGRILVRIKESVGVPIGDVQRKNSGAAASRLYYSCVWEPAAVEAAAGDSVLPALLLFDTDARVRDLYRKRLDEAGSSADRVVLVQPGTAFRDVGDSIYEIDPREPGDFVRLIECMTQRRHGLEQICFAWPLRTAASASVGERLDHGVYSLLFLCQALIRFKLEKSAQLLYLYADATTRPQDEAISGFLKTLRLEHGKVQCRAVEIQGAHEAPERCLDVLLAEYRGRATDAVTVRHSDTGRSVRKLAHEDLDTQVVAQTAGCAVREGGVYLITGGAGGLGLIFAEFLATQACVRLVLTGRSSASAALESRLEGLRKLGSQVLYVAADVADGEAVQAVVAHAKRQFGAINGVIHSAGVLRDSYIRNKTRAEMEAVLAPKVLGTLHLDEATQQEPLDFFVLFSSLAAVAGNAGQCDYAFANHFMDSYAAGREQLRAQGQRSGRTLSLNWSLWADGGMKLDAQTQQLFTKTLGVRLLSVESGTQAFIQAIASAKTQLAVIEGDREKIETVWGLRKKPPQPEPEAQPRSLQTPAADAATDHGAEHDLLGLVRNELTQLVMKLLKLGASETSADSILLDLGFDSIGLTTFANEINAKYAGDVTPVLFFDYPSIEEIAKYLCKERRQDVLRFHKTAKDAGGATAPQPAAAADQAERDDPAVLQITKAWHAPEHGAVAVHAGPPDPSHRFAAQPIAIVGMSAVLPQSDDVDEFWRNLAAARNLVTVIPRDRWNWEEYFGDPFKEVNKSNSKWGGFMRQVDKFDPPFFGISRREAQMMDPQQRLFLQTVWQAIEDSGHKVSDLSGTRTGLFVGVATNDYADVLIRSQAGLDGYTASGNSHSVLANRVSFLLNLRGPSAPIDTACSSSLIALHRAVESIHTGSCDMAIVGGVQVMLSPAAYISFSRAGMLSPDGRCKAFDKRADGYVRGEGVGAVLLKSLAAAEADGDHIYAVIRGTAENHGGRVTTLTAPNSAAQAELVIEAYEKARIDPTTVGYIECHGTGTGIGDPIEVQALSRAFAEMYRRQGHPPAAAPHCGLSSVKTNIGHLETAAGIAAVIKVLLAIRHRQIPANLHFEELNPYINLKGTPFYVVDKTSDWPAPSANGVSLPRRAGVSSFGFGGANAHVVLEEYNSPERTDAHAAVQAGPQLIVLSAKSEDRLKAYARSLLTHLQTSQPDLADLAYTLQVGRDEMQQRLALIAASVDELQQKLRMFVDGGDDHHGIRRGDVKGRRQDMPAETSIGTLIEGRELSRLADLWVGGAAIPWRELHRDRAPRRLSLPTYPFATERCWITAESGNGGLRSVAIAAAARQTQSAAPEATQIPTGSSAPDVTFYRSVWRESPLGAKARAPRPLENVLLFANSEPARTAIAERLAMSGAPSARITLVRAAPAYAEREHGVFEIDPRNEAHYRELAGTLLRRGTWPECVVHMWSAADFGNDACALGASLDKGALSLLQASKALMQVPLENGSGTGSTVRPGATKILYVHPSTPLEPQPQHAAVAAFANCLALENSRFECKSIELQSDAQCADPTPATIAELLLDELQGGSFASTQVRYLEGRRWVKALETFELPRVVEPPLKQGGVYLITGGIGGLGMLFARYLFERSRARLVLSGRSALDEAHEAKLAELRSAGAEVLYVQADAAQRVDVERLLATIKARFGALNGILHGAGVLRDAALHRKTMEEVQSVLAPKIYGTVHLDEATRTEQLDFFAVFSSVAAIVGNAGQSDYAYANSFLDHFVERRNLLAARGERSGLALALNWPLWEAGGMQVDARIAAFLKESAGIEPLDSESGLDAFARALAGGCSQVLVMKGDADRIRERLLNRLARADSVPSVQPATQEHLPAISAAAARDREIGTRVQKDLLQLVAKIALVTEAEISPDAKLGEYGMDSINLADLARRINERYGLNLRAAVFFEHPTLSSLAQFLVSEHAGAVTRQLGATNVVPSAAAVPLVASAASVDAASGKGHEIAKHSVGSSGRRSAQAGDDEIAIVGVSGVFPQCTSLDTFWGRILAGHDLVTDIPSERWDWRAYQGDPLQEKNTTNSQWGGFLPEVDKFDAAFFGIAPAEARLMDPQQRIFLEMAWKAIEDAGERPSALAGTQTGVYVGVGRFEYVDILRNADVSAVSYAATGMAACVLPNRVSYLLDLRGPSEPVDTACSSSMVALHRAVEAIASGACEMAIAGGVNVLLSPSLYIALGNAGVLASDGKCKAFDRRADGYVRGEGCGAVLLKPLKRALADGNPIYAVVKGSGVSHGGRAMSLTAPNPNAQADLLIDVYRRAGIDPRTVGYIEAHGTGTALGDAVEINALKKAFHALGAGTNSADCPPAWCGLGSVKTNIGHTEAASGIAGLIKVLLALKHGRIPGNPHFQELSPHIQIDGSPFHVVKDACDWVAMKDASGQDLPRTAGVSSFGFGGVNAHVIVQEYSRASVAASVMPIPGGPRRYIIPVSARSADRLLQVARDLLRHVRSLAGTGEDALASIAYTLQVGREAMAERLGMLVESVDELASKLQAYVNGETRIAGLYRLRADRDADSIGPINRDADIRQAIIGRWLARGDLESVLEMWVKGLEVDWNSLYGAVRPPRVSLPTYPFARDRHWVECTDDIPADASSEQQNSAAHWRMAGEHASSESTHSTAAHRIERVLMENVARELRTSVAELSPMKSFLELGLGSLGITRLVDAINQLLDVKLSPSLLFQYPTIGQLGAYLAETYPEQIRSVVSIDRLLERVRWNASATDASYAATTF